MSSPREGNGNRNDMYLQYTGAPLQEAPLVNHLLQQQQNAQVYGNVSEGGFPIHQGPPNPILWQNALIGAPFIQTAAILQNQQQQHQYNEYMFNLHMQQTLPIPPPPPPQQETYSVLPVGHGNFLKIYHSAESGETVSQNEMNQQSFQPHFHHTQHHSNNFHVAQQNISQVQPQIFNNYELFSSSGTLLSPHDITVPSNTNQASSSSTTASQTFSQSQNVINDKETLNTTNLIINNLVNNWSPNLTGDSYMNLAESLSQSKDSCPIKTEIDSAPLETSLQEEEIVPLGPNKSINVHSLRGNKSVEEKENKSFNENPKSIKPANVVPETKKRIVAEVKPMRMTYSDVLSKVNKTEHLSSSKTGSTTSSKTSIKLTTANNILNERKTEKSSQRQLNETDSNVQRSFAKKSPTHEVKESQNNQSNKIKKRSNSGNSSYQSSSNNSASKSSQVTTKVNQKSNASGSGSGSEGNTKKRYSSKQNDSNSDSNSSSSYINKSSKKESSFVEKDPSTFYNVTVKNTDSKANNATSSNNNNATVSCSNYRKANKPSNQANNSTNNGVSYSNQQSRPKYSNSNTSYSFSSKRSRGNNYSVNSSSSNTAMASTNKNYELAKKFLKVWGNYMLRALLWFYYLIYDIIVLSCTMLYDRFTHLCINGYEYSKQLYKDFKNNSNKPNIWIKNHWKKFDGKFKKDSKWAFWRRFYDRKPPEPAPENYKTGRLPTTGEEAMYSLLNCKGKDAYSILGVPPNCPQEQIRKHYKKIAVLVHPDKNKQAGAEEAFKVLQRAFELIGEPESRLSYDKSLVEALQAEKAWSELHVLLSQLQTKIAEAANTIRCSTCSLRHPRKLVERPHYAARQCGACKTFHSAREGDIWAETYCFGIRWKYLALMEGKVYDVTQWAFCQKGALAHLEPNSHLVQYRIVRGAQQQQQEQQQQSQKHRDGSKRHPSSHANPEYSSGKAPWEHANFKHDIPPPSDTRFQDFLDNLYGGQKPNQKQNSAYSGSSRRRSRRN